MDRRNLGILVLAFAALLTMCLFFFLLTRKKDLPSKAPTGTDTAQTATTNSGGTITGKKTGSSNGSNGSHSGGKTGPSDGTSYPVGPGSRPGGQSSGGSAPLPAVSKDTAEEIAMMMSEMNSHQEKIRLESEKWAEQFLKDPKLASNTRETFRFRNIAEYGLATKAMNSGDYQTAIKEFQKAMENPNASPVTRYVCLDYMRCAAVKMNDVELYIQLLQQQAKLISEENLTVLGISKTTSEIKIANDIADHLRASKSQSALNDLIDKKAREFKMDTAEARALIELNVRNRMKQLEQIFK